MLGQKRGEPGERSLTGPVQLDQFARILASLLIPHDDAPADAEVSVPPRFVEAAGVGRDPQLKVAGFVGLLADGLEPRGDGVNVTRDHGDAVSWFVGLANGEGNDGAAISGKNVLAAGLQLVGPRARGVEL